jgi:hypothetical protein
MTTPTPESDGGLGALGDLLTAARQRLASTSVEATAGGGMVRVTMDGERRTRSITIAPSAMEATPEELAELLLAALGEAWELANAAKSSAIEGLIPGARTLP